MHVMRGITTMLKFPRLSHMLAQPSPRVIWTAAVCGLAIQFAVFAAIAFDSYRDTLATSFEVAENIATLIERDIARNIELYDLSLRAVTESVSDPEVMALPPRLKQMAVFDRTTTAPGLGAMVVLDKNGQIFLDSYQSPPRAGNFSDREYFKFQRDTPNADGLYFSRPFQARLQQDAWSISISRRINAIDGSFAGIVSGTIKLDFIRDRMESVALGKRGIASFFRSDGIVFAQNVIDSPNVGADWSRAELFKRLAGSLSGTYSGNGTIDKVPRLYAYRSVSGFPMVVNAGIARDDVLAPWWFKVQMIAAVFLMMAASVLVLVFMFNRELRRRIAAEQGQASLARRDQLSQLANRLGFDEALDIAWRRGTRDRKPLSLVMIDADYFKQFNDRYGHLEGDKVLMAISKVIGGAAGRPDDLSARYGGEEFAVLLPNTAAEGAEIVAELIRKRVAGLAITHEKSGEGIVTISLGVAAVIPGKGMSSQALVANADRALYAAKAAGRNRVSVDRIVGFQGSYAERLQA